MNNCLNCSNETSNPKFCSRSCAASFNNRHSPKKKKKENFCDSCSTTLPTRNKYCKECRKPKDITLKEAIYQKHHKSSAYALVRARARAAAKKADWCSCKNCGYDKHVEIAHIKAISEFPDETLISEVNDLSNLVPLCPNCHWEYDRGRLTI